MNIKAQSIIEYSVLIGAIIAAIIAMEVYVKRSMQGRFRENLTQLTDGANYSPGATVSVSTSVININQSSVSANRVSTSESDVRQVTNKIEDVLPFAAEPARW